MFNRSDYLSQTEVLETYRITSSAYQKLLIQHKIDVVKRDADLGGYVVTALYVKREDVNMLKLKPR